MKPPRPLLRPHPQATPLHPRPCGPHPARTGRHPRPLGRGGRPAGPRRLCGPRRGQRLPRRDLPGAEGKGNAPVRRIPHPPPGAGGVEGFGG